MRYNKRIVFVINEQRRYDPVEGKNRVVRELSNPLPCHISDLGIDRTMAVFGESKRDVKVVRLQNGLDYNPISAQLNGKDYDIENHRLNNRVYYLVGDE